MLACALWVSSTPAHSQKKKVHHKWSTTHSPKSGTCSKLQQIQWRWFQTHLKKIEDHVQQAKTSTQRAQIIQRETKKKTPTTSTPTTAAAEDTLQDTSLF
jgi:hypothetical protein